MRAHDEAASPETPPERLAVLAAQDEALALLVAQNPAAPAALLARLAAHANEGVVRGVAQNPNTPLPELLRLAPKHPQAFQDNPLLPLLLLEDPNLFGRFDDNALLALLGAPDPSPPLLEFALTHRQLSCRKLAAAKLKDPVRLKGLLADPHKEVAHAAMQNPYLPENLFRRFYEAREKSIASEAELLALAQFGLWPRALVVAAKQTPLSLVISLLSDFQLDVCLAALSRPVLPSGVLDDLLRHYLRPELKESRLYQVLLAIAAHNNCTTAQLSLLVSHSTFDSLQEVVAAHPALGVEEMRALCGASYAGVRVKLAARRDLTPQLQERLSEDLAEQVRSVLAPRHPSVMAECARWRRRLDEEGVTEEEALLLAKRGDNAVFDLLLHPKTPARARQQLSLQPSRPLLEKLSTSKLAPSAADLLISTGSEALCLAVARSRMAREGTLLRLAPLAKPIKEGLHRIHHRRISVLVALLEHGYTPVAETILSQKKPTREQLLLVLKQIPKPWKRLSIKLCGAVNLPEEALPILLPRYWSYLSAHQQLGVWCQRADLVALFPRAMKKRLKQNPFFRDFIKV